MDATTTAAIRDAAQAAYVNDKPRAYKRGRTSALPYVPVILHFDPEHPGDALHATQEQLLGLAFATRDEAIACADGALLRREQDLRAKLEQRQNRALREHLGLPREIGA